MKNESVEVSKSAYSVLSSNHELLYSVPHQDVIQQLNSNIEKLEDLCLQLNFVMREIKAVMKIQTPEQNH